MSAPEPDRATERERQRIDELEREVGALRAQLHAAWGQLQGMRASASWRITYPLRAIRRVWRR